MTEIRNGDVWRSPSTHSRYIVQYCGDGVWGFLTEPYDHAETTGTAMMFCAFDTDGRLFFSAEDAVALIERFKWILEPSLAVALVSRGTP